MDVLITRAPSVNGTLRLPADKAICHRAALLCALTTGATDISPWARAEDCQQTVNLLKALGVGISATADGIRIKGVGLAGLRAPRTSLFCGDSGTTMRLACGLLAGQPFASHLTAGASLSHRPMRRIVEPLSQMGARLEGGQQGGEVYPPLTVTGRRPLSAIRYAMPMASAQVKSAILLAGLFADRPTTIVEPVATRDHTERLLGWLGVSIHSTERTITLEPPRDEIPAPAELTIPADPSSAAFFIIAASILPGSRLLITDVGLNPTRIAFVEVLRRMGAAIHVQPQDDDWEPRGTITVEAAPLSGTTVSADEVPSLIDELPALMVAACAAEGETRFEGLEELRVKETDRLRSMTTGLTQLGARVQRDGPSAVIMGNSRLRGTAVDSFQDHRTAMSLAIAGLMAEGETRIRGAECVAKSLGDFFELLASVAGAESVKTG